MSKDKKDKITVNGELKNFKNFLLAGSVVAVAIGVIVASATKDVVDVLVQGIITPFIQLILPDEFLGDLIWKVGDSEFLIGELFNSAIQLVITLLIVYLLARYIIKNDKIIGLEEKEK